MTFLKKTKHNKNIMMKPEFENIPLTKTENRFEIEFNGHSAFIDYREMGSQIALNHTEADLLISGRGAAAAVVEKTPPVYRRSS